MKKKKTQEKQKVIVAKSQNNNCMNIVRWQQKDCKGCWHCDVCTSTWKGNFKRSKR